jgi:hypothetical protein
VTYITVEYGIPRVVASLWTLKPNRLAIIKRTWQHCHAFDGNSRYELVVADPPRVSAFQRILAYTIYNPAVTVESTWQRVADCSTADIIDLVRVGLASDDDIITQWFDGDEVIALLESAQTWEDLVVAVRCIGGEHETDSNVSAYAKRILVAN